MNSTKNGQPVIKPEWRLIHMALHSKSAATVRLGRREYEIMLSDNLCRYVDYDNIRFVEQNKESKSELGRKARRGERITWCNPHAATERPFVIDQHTLLQQVQEATISLPLKQVQNANIVAKTITGVPADTIGEQSATGSVPAHTKRASGKKPAGAGKSKKPAAKRSSRGLGEK